MRCFVCVLTFWLACCVGVSASVDVPGKLTVQGAIGIALGSNVSLKQSEYARLDSLAGYRKAKILTNYSLTAETGATTGQGTTTTIGDVGSTLSYLSPFGTQAQISVSPFGIGTSRGAVGLSITKPLLKGSGFLADKYNLMENARSGVTIQEKSLQYSKQSTILQVISAYYQAVLAREQVNIQQSAVKAAQDSADFLRRKVNAGFEAGMGLTQADVAVMQAKESLNSAQLAARSAMDSLMLTMGVGVGRTPELVDDVPDYDPALPLLDEAIKMAQTNRVEITQLNESLAQQRRAYAVANDQLRSDLGLTANWTSAAGSAGIVDQSLLDSGSTFVGLKLSMPIDKRALREDRDTSARALDLLQKQRIFEDEQLADDVRNDYHGVESARASVVNLSENQKVVGLQVYQAQRRLEEGLGTTFDLVKAQNDQASFNVQLKTAKENLYLAHLRFELAIGADVIAAGTK